MHFLPFSTFMYGSVYNPGSFLGYLCFYYVLCVYVAGLIQAGSFLPRLVVLYQGPGLVRVFVRITSLRGVISANLVRGLGYRLGSSRSLLFG